MPAQSRRHALRQPGFEVHGAIFSNEAIPDALLDTYSYPLSYSSFLKDRCHDRLVAFFNTLVTHKCLFLALRGYDAVWEVVTGEWRAYNFLATAQVKELAQAYSTARRAYQLGNADHTSHLTAIVDQWIQVEDQIRSLPPLTQFILPERPDAANDEDFIEALQTTNITAAWPASHFNATEIAFLAHPRFTEVLMGVTVDSAGQLPPRPDQMCSPWTTRLWLCHTALKALTESKKLLFMTPVGFLDNGSQQAWYEAMGAQSKVFGTVDHFVEYAADGLVARGKDMVAGLLNT